MNPIQVIRRLAAVLAGLAAAVLAAIAAAPAAFATLPPGSPKSSPAPSAPPRPPVLPAGWTSKHPPLTPAHVHVAVAAGLPGWQIALIAAGAAVLGAAIAVLLERTWAGRRRVSASAA
jgi:glucose/arabinose dehydrogenase